MNNERNNVTLRPIALQICQSIGYSSVDAVEANFIEHIGTEHGHLLAQIGSAILLVDKKERAYDKALYQLNVVIIAMANARKNGSLQDHKAFNRAATKLNTSYVELQDHIWSTDVLVLKYNELYG